jgi:S-adenosylmethionine decarboxylase
VYKGRHLLVDCQNVSSEICLDDKRFLEIMARAAEQAGATVISQVRYRFGEGTPPGFAAVVLLDESHCSAHSYADLGLLAIDIFTCGQTDPRDLLNSIREEVNLGDFSVREFDRFSPRDDSNTTQVFQAAST